MNNVELLPRREHALEATMSRFTEFTRERRHLHDVSLATTLLAHARFQMATFGVAHTVQDEAMLCCRCGGWIEGERVQRRPPFGLSNPSLLELRSIPKLICAAALVDVGEKEGRNGGGNLGSSRAGRLSRQAEAWNKGRGEGQGGAEWRLDGWRQQRQGITPPRTCRQLYLLQRDTCAPSCRCKTPWGLQVRMRF